MGKSIDFTKAGGFPLTQDRLAYLQTAYNELLVTLAAIGGSAGLGAVPVILNGMAVSGGGNTVSSGWFFYNGQIVKFTGGTVVPGGGEVALVLLTTTSGALTYNDGSTPSVINETTASLTHAATVTDATHFPVSALVPWVAIDATLYADVTAINSTLTLLKALWTNEPPVAIGVTSGGGTFAGGTWAYNKFKYAPLNTIDWMFSLRGWIVTGTVNGLIISPPATFATGGGSWDNIGFKFLIHSDHSGPTTILRGTLKDTGSGPYLLIEDPTGALATGGGMNIDVVISQPTT